MDRKECYRLTHTLSKISGYATDMSISNSAEVAVSHSSYSS